MRRNTTAQRIELEKMEKWIGIVGYMKAGAERGGGI
jgi:hypothetical protein